MICSLYPQRVCGEEVTKYNPLHLAALRSSAAVTEALLSIEERRAEYVATLDNVSTTIFFTHRFHPGRDLVGQQDSSTFGIDARC